MASISSFRSGENRPFYLYQRARRQVSAVTLEQERAELIEVSEAGDEEGHLDERLEAALLRRGDAGKLREYFRCLLGNATPLCRRAKCGQAGYEKQAVALHGVHIGANGRGQVGVVFPFGASRGRLVRLSALVER